MRFEDTLAGWQSQLDYLLSNKHIAAYLKAISPLPVKIIQNTVSNEGDPSKNRMCHQIVRDRVTECGGSAVFGWQIRPWNSSDDPQYDYILNSGFHSNWLSPDNQLINLTPTQGSYHIFLPDPKRKYDFDNNISFNNRTIYLDGYSPPPNARKPSTNVTYFTAGIYGSRDRTFEKFKMPKDKAEINAALSDRFFTPGPNGYSLSPEGREWLHLK